MITITRFIVGFAFALLSPVATDDALAQAPSSTQPTIDRSALNQRVSYFYRDGRIENVPDILSNWQIAHGPVAPLLGFIIGVAAKYPDRIDQMFPPTLDNGSQRLAVVGVRVGISTERAKKLAHSYGWPEKDVVRIGDGATIDKLAIRIPADQDMFWGASFATGDPRYPQRILEHYASIANRDDIDIKQVMALIRSIPGYSPGILKTVKEKEGDQKVRDLLMAASGLWSLESNAAQHEFVRKVVNAYVTANPNTPAAGGLRQIAAAAQAERSKSGAPR